MRDRRPLEITLASTPGELNEIRGLWSEYWDSLRLPPEFQNFAQELDSLPGAYAAPKGRLLLARIEDQPAGSAAFRPLNAHSCEAKRLYVRPEHRRKGIGKALLGRLLADARAAGYSDMYADTLSTMESALLMYKEVGFAEVPPYSANPTPNAIFLKLHL
jgi:GNAT superfamily N-acetyltransferase